MGDDITIGVTEIVNNIEVTAQPNDQIVDISVIDNADDVTLNITPTVIEINVNKGSSYAKWGTILGTLSDQTDLQNALDLKANLVGGKVPASELPSYVDDVVEVADYAALPTTGETGKIYVTLDNNKIYRWSGSIYIEIAANNAIWGSITGTLSNQTDLQSALDAKALKTITITPNAPLSGGGDLSANRTISISQSNTTTDGYLSSTDWNTFNSKQSALTNPITGTGTTNKLPKFTGSTTISDSNITDNGTIVSISTNATINNVNIGVGSGSATGFSTTVGASALVNNTTGLGNTAIGHSTLLFNTTGNYNTANGMFALKANISGNDNTSIGFNTLLSNTTGSNNTAIGSNSILAFTTGSNNTAIGYGAGGNAISSSSNNVYLGNRAGSNSFVTENNKLYIANAAGTPLIGGDFSAKTIAIDGTITATSIIKSGGTSSQFLKADGSVDSSTYALDNAVVHLTGAETITGEKSFNNATSSSSIFVTNSSTGNGISSFNTSTGNALYLNNNSTGKAAYINNISSGIGLFVNNTTAATGLPFVIAKSNSNVLTINDAGEITGTKFVKSGGTSSQFLKADGSVDSSTYALDNSVVHLAGSETITGLKTFSNMPILSAASGVDGQIIYANASNQLKTITNFKYNESTGVLTTLLGNLGSNAYTSTAYQPLLTNPITGTGTTNYLPKFTGSTSLGNSLIYDNGTNVGIGTTSPASMLHAKASGYPTLTLEGGTNSGAGIRFFGDVQYAEIFGEYESATNGQMFFRTRKAGTISTAMTILSSGNVGIGTTSPSSALDVNGNVRIGSGTLSVPAYSFRNSTNTGFYLTDDGSGALINVGIGATNIATFKHNGNVGIGTTSPSYQLQLSTDSAAKLTSALWTIASDERIKENINSYTKGLNELLKINPITYDYNGLGGFKKGKGGVGIIAQEIAEILPDSVSSIKGKLNETDEEEIDILNFNGHELTYILINAVKELKAEIEILKNK